jgi:hypothetical protein
MTGTGEWLAGGVSLLNNFFVIYFEPISKIHYAGTRRLAGVAPANTNAF